MNTFFKDALSTPLEENETVFGTELKKDTLHINQKTLNLQVAKAIRMLPFVHEFGKGSVSVSIQFLPTEIDDVFVYQNEGTVIVLQYVKHEGINRIFINKNAIEPYKLIQSLLLLEIATNQQASSIGEKIVAFATTPFIKAHDHEEIAFGELILEIEEFIKQGTYDPYHSIEIVDEILVYPIPNMLEKLGVFSVSESVDADREETMETNENEPELPIETYVEDTVELTNDPTTESVETTPDFEQTSLFEETTPLDAIELSQLIQQLKNKGIKAKDIAEKANVAPSTISKFSDEETAKNASLSLKSLKKVSAAVLEMTASLETETETEEPTATELPLSELAQQEATTTTSVLKTVSYDQTLDIETLKKECPRFFDDVWIDEYLAQFEIEQQWIDFIKTYRAEQRERLLRDFPETIVYIEQKAVYEGWDTPIRRAIVALFTRSPLLLSGETGVGKTTLVQTLSCLFNSPLFTANCNDETNTQTFTGFKTLENGEIKFVYGRLARPMKVGGIFYADEANRSRKNVFAILNGPLDHRRQLNIDETSELIKAHENFQFVASINEGYEDTQEMSEQTLRRLVAIKMKSLTELQLKNLLNKLDGGWTAFQKEVLRFGKVSAADMRLLGQISTKLQEAVQKGELPAYAASTSDIIQILTLSRMPSFTFEEAIYMIADRYIDDIRSPFLGALAGIDNLKLRGDEIAS